MKNDSSGRRNIYLCIFNQLEIDKEKFILIILLLHSKYYEYSHLYKKNNFAWLPPPPQMNKKSHGKFIFPPLYLSRSLLLLSDSSSLSFLFFFVFCFFVFFFSTNSPAICLIADMAECKVLKLSSHLAPSPFRHLSLHQPARLHQQASSTPASLQSDYSIRLVIITCLPHTYPALINVVYNICNSPPPFHQPSLDPRTCWSPQSVSIVVVMLVIIVSLVVITIASQCVQQQSHSWISNQHRRPISPSTSLTIEF